jgi:hypothetical protein
MRFTRYFTNLEFYPTDTRLGPRIQARRVLSVGGAYLLLSLGIFARQIIDLPAIRFAPEQANTSVLAASFIVALAVFPPFMRWINIHRPVPGIEHILAPFTVGFFLNLLLKFLVKSWYLA